MEVSHTQSHFKLAYTQLALSDTITCQLMRYAINSVTNAFNSWSYSAKLSLVYYPLMSTFTYYHKPYTYGPFVNAKGEGGKSRGATT